MQTPAPMAQIEIIDAPPPPRARQRAASKASSGDWRPVVAPAERGRRFLQLVIPSAWVILAALIMAAWRVLTVHARGDLNALHSMDMVLGIVADLAIAHAMMLSVRALSLLGTQHVDIKSDVTRNSTLAFAMMWMGASLLRLAALVQAALNDRPLDAAFWLPLLREPAVWLTNDAVWAALAAALATAALVRYCMTSDLEIVQALDAAEPRGYLIRWTAIPLAFAVLTAIGVHVASGGGADSPAALPEISGLDTLSEALHDPQLRQTPED